MKVTESPASIRESRNRGTSGASVLVKGLQHPREWGCCFEDELTSARSSAGTAHPLQPLEVLSTSPFAGSRKVPGGLKAEKGEADY